MGLSTDKDQPIELKSDRAIRNEKGGFTQYSGNVTLKQGSLFIQADSLKIFHTSGHAKKIIALGSPASLRQKPNPNKPEISATASKMTYDRRKNTVILKNNAKIRQADSTVTGDKITYSISEQKVIAESNKNAETGRVNVVLPSDLIGEN